MIKKLAQRLIAFYQRYLSVISFGSCRYYPSCSEYAMQQFQKNNILVAFYQSTLRILRCNQLFVGGIDYPLVASKKLSLSKDSFLKTKTRCDFKIKFWLVPKNEKYYYVIKQFKY